MRNNTRKVMVGNVQIGGSKDVIIQSMTSLDTSDVVNTVKQILDLEKAGCQIVRVTVQNMSDAEAIKEIKKQINIPLVADIHFNYKLALKAIENGIDKIRINPGNIGSKENVQKVVNACKEKKIPIRIGVNAGSLEKHLLEEYGYPTAEAMVKSALYHINILEELDFHDIVVSLKASNVLLTVEAYEMAAKVINYPLHLGVTEAGTKFGGSIKSAVGLGILLNKGIGSTIRVSLSDNPVEEIKVAKEILKQFGLISNMPTLISCPTCGRNRIDLIGYAKEIEEFLETIPHKITVAILGCAVNGPGEAREADIGIAGGDKEGLLFKKGEIVRKVPETELIAVLKEEILLMAREMEQK